MIKYGDRISVAMISMNEEGSIKKIVEEIFNIDDRIEIILVDSSTDNTFEIAEKLGVNAIKQFPPKGYGLAMDLALKSCTKEIIITMDCDSTYPTDKIDFLSKLIFEENYKLIDCNRLERKPQNMRLINYIGNKIFSIFASILFLRKIPDLHSGMRAYNKETLNNINYFANGPSLPVELLLSFYKRKLKLKHININYFERVGESKMAPLETSIWTIKRILKVRFESIS
ncbi:glycosyltransferase [Candidatus Pelagibacter sp. HIMB1746]|uniref:glycosyltransferase n=1 Tax=Candidatus Pelagibacter sp. HIMB1746 TaxID=3413370 RepID=UPI003F8799EC